MKHALLTLALLGGAALAQSTSPTPAQPVTPPAPTTPTPTTPVPTPPAPTTLPATPAPATPAPASVAPATPTAATSPTVATLGQQTLTLADFEVAFRIAVAGILNDQGMPYDEQMLPEFAGARADYLKVFVRERGLEQLARTSVKPDAATIDARLADIRADFGDDAGFSAALAAAGYLSPAELRAELERQNVVNTYLAGIEKRTTFGDFVVNNYYNLHRAEFQQDKQACAKHILVPTQAEADAVAQDLRGGADFAALAKAKSQDPGSAAQGGDLGCFAPGQMVETFDKASFTGPLNAAQVVQSEFGWHVVLVTKRSDGGLLPLAQAAPLIREKLARDAAQKYVDAQLARLNAKTFPDVVAAPAPATQ